MARDAVGDAVAAIGEMRSSGSVLLIGSGFSLEAKNIAGESPPNGNGLRKHFIKQLRLPADCDYSLQILADEFAREDPSRLRDELYRIFRVAEVSCSQRNILKEPWQRIYTTNYDDVVEKYRRDMSLEPNDFDVSAHVPNRVPAGAVVHLHGSIRVVNAENVRKSLVLGEASYVDQYSMRNPWYGQFQRDIAYADALFVIGYSLSDYHIASLLQENPALIGRTFFIHGPSRDEFLERKTASFGASLFIGVEGFSSVLDTVPRAGKKTDLAQLKSLRSLNPTKDGRSLSQPTATEIFDLLVYGQFEASCLARSHADNVYAFSRDSKVQTAAGALERNRSLVVDGRTGNGKSIFIQLLTAHLSRNGWNCFKFRTSERKDFASELAVLRTTPQVVVVLEGYAAIQQELAALSNALPDAKFVLEMSSGTFDVRYHEVSSVLPKPFDRVTLNKLEPGEYKSFSKLCESIGLQAPDGAAQDLRELLLEMFQNRSIRDSLDAMLHPVLSSREAGKVLVMLMLLSVHQGKVNPGFLRSVVGFDPFVALRAFQDAADDVVEISEDELRARSPVFSAFVLENFVDKKTLVDVIAELTLAAAERRKEVSYRIVMSSLMAYGKLRKVLRGRSDFAALIEALYERLRYDERISGEPLFWLQYAIAMAEVPKLDAAQQFIEAAYRKAKDLPGFETYQIDTQALRIEMLVAIAAGSGKPVEGLDLILNGMQKINSMLGKDSHRDYAVRVLEKVPVLVTTRRADFSKSEAVAVKITILQLAESLQSLPDSFKLASASEPVRRSLVEAAAKIVSL